MEKLSIMSAGRGTAQWIFCRRVSDGQSSGANLRFKHRLIVGPLGVRRAQRCFEPRAAGVTCQVASAAVLPPFLTPPA